MTRKTINILLLFAVSIFSFAFHFVEVLLRGWDYLYLVTYFLAQLVNVGLEKLITCFSYISITDMIFQFKTGSIIFAYMLVEGLFIELHRKNMDRQTAGTK
ncbi:hypothetical protein [Treponema sp.]|uniref:hypothetical protein n=1 Tax=Treponema sp. TaxID=166 RepID=UPI00298EAD65|nr:hypothetical protein [Treponema sp.]MCR5612118.1 hypothetical protein [Treponema sp.]